jgi:hypothetical protein
MPNQPEDLQPPKDMFLAPPAYSRYDQTANITQTSPDNDHQSLNSHCKLPTYEEVQMEKILNDEIPFASMLNPPPPPPIHPSMRAQNQQNDMAFVSIESNDEIGGDNSLLGTDVVFVTAFFISFIFNWLGFLLLTCFCHTIAGKIKY